MADEKAYTACILDTETGGLTPAECAITQLSCKMIRLDTLESLGTFDAYIKPYPKRPDWDDKARRKVLKTKREIAKEEGNGFFKYEPKALEVTGITMDKLRIEGQDIVEVAKSFVEFVKSKQMGKHISYKPYLTGQNILFDWGFLQHLFVNAGMEEDLYNLFQGSKDMRGNFIPLLYDTLTLSRIALCNDPSITTYKLESICEKLKIELVDAHSSMADVEATCGVFSVLASRMRSMTDIDPSVFVQEGEKFREHFKI